MLLQHFQASLDAFNHWKKTNSISKQFDQAFREKLQVLDDALTKANQDIENTKRQKTADVHVPAVLGKIASVYDALLRNIVKHKDLINDRVRQQFEEERLTDEEALSVSSLYLTQDYKTRRSMSFEMCSFRESVFIGGVAVFNLLVGITFLLFGLLPVLDGWAANISIGIGSGYFLLVIIYLTVQLKSSCHIKKTKEVTATYDHTDELRPLDEACRALVQLLNAIKSEPHPSGLVVMCSEPHPSGSLHRLAVMCEEGGGFELPDPLLQPELLYAGPAFLSEDELHNIPLIPPPPCPAPSSR